MPSTDTSPLCLFVERLAARSVLTEEERRQILALPAHSIRLSKKQDFVHINEETSYACLVGFGMVGRFGQTSTGVRQITALHVPGDMVDLHSTVRPVGIGGLCALTETTIFRIPHTALREIAAAYPAIAEAFWRDCMLDAAVLMQWVVNVGRRDAQTRLAHIFCEMAIRSGADREVLRDYVFPLTQEQLGDAAALTSVHVNRSMKALQGLVTLKGGRVRIHNWLKLAQRGEFEDSYLVPDTVSHRQKRLLTAA